MPQEIMSGEQRNTETYETPETNFEKGLQYYKKGNLHLAEKYLDRAWKMGYEGNNLKTLMGFVYSELGRLNEAETAFNEALVVCSADIKAVLGKGELHLRRKEFLQAEDSFRRALNINPENGRAWNDMGMLYLYLGATERAMVYFKNAMELGNEEARFNLSAILYEKNRLAEAKETLEPLLESDNYQWEVCLNLGYILLKEGKFDEALRYLNQASDTIKSNLDANYSAGLAFYYNGDFERAIAAFERALAYNPNYFPAKNALASCISRIAMNSTMTQDTVLNNAYRLIKYNSSVKGLGRVLEFSFADDIDDKPMISIIVLAAEENNNLIECLNRCNALQYPRYEIIILPDEPLKNRVQFAREIPTGKSTPDFKLWMGAKEARGAVLAIIDENSYPAKNWLQDASKLLSNKKVSVVYGSTVTDSARGKTNLFRNMVNFIKRTLHFPFDGQTPAFNLPLNNFLIRKDDFLRSSVQNADSADQFSLKSIKDKLKKEVVHCPSMMIYKEH